MAAGLWVAQGTVWKRKGRGDRQTVVAPAPFTRPTGPGYYAIEDLGKPLTHAGVVAAMTQVKGLATGVDTIVPGRVHRTLTLPAMTISCPGFAASAGNAGILFAEGVGLVGAGEDATIFQIAPDSITQAQVDQWYPADVYPSTIGLKVVLIANGYTARAGSLANVRFAQFGVRGTQQRIGGTKYPTTTATNWNTYHYNGISASRMDGDIYEDIKVWGIPGFKNSPPGETFHITKYLGTGGTYRRVTVDGRNDAGTQVGSAGIATNTTTNIVVEDCLAHYMGHSHGFAFWETNNIDIDNCTSVHNGGSIPSDLGGTSGDGFNFERSRDSRLIDSTVGYNSLCELRYYARDDGDSYDGDTSPHYIENLTVLEGALDIRIDNAQVTHPTLVGSPAPVYDEN